MNETGLLHHINWTDAGAVFIIFYIVIKLLREIKSFIELRNGKAVVGTLDNLPVHCQKGISEHCRKCHVLLADIRAFQNSLDKYLPKAIDKELENIKVNQKGLMMCQKDMLANQTKIISDLVIMEDHCEGRYTGTKRSLNEILTEIKKYEGALKRSPEILRLIQEHNTKSAKVIDAIMREKKL
jgi:hypothetical protein